VISGSFEAVWGGGWLVNCYSKNNRENGKNIKLEKQKQKKHWRELSGGLPSCPLR